MKKNNKKKIIFDMDGTLYEFKEGSFKSSGLYDIIIANTISYISSRLGKNKLEAQIILDLILEKYGDSISIGLEKEFKIDRHEYFNFAWNIEVEKYVQFNSGLKEFFLNLKDDFELYLLSDAPMIWIVKVLKYLGISEVFEGNIFSGEGDIRKEFNNAFGEIMKILDVRSENCIVVGDQEETDIAPAKRVGMRTIYVGENKDTIADYKIKNILELKELINKL